MANYTAPRTWVAGETPTDAMLNAQIHDNMIELMRATNVWAHNFGGAAPTAGGVIPFRMQVGTNVNTLDASGVASVVYTTPMLNATMVVMITNGDYSSAGDLTFATYPGGGLAASGFSYGGFRNGALVAGVTHRINWIAIGW